MAMSTSCSVSFWMLTHGSLADACTRDVGFSLATVSPRLAPAAIAAICASSHCLDMVASIAQAMPIECVISSRVGGLQLYKDLLDPISQNCAVTPARALIAQDTTTPTPTPRRPLLVTRTPRPTTASPLVNPLKTPILPPTEAATTTMPPQNVTVDNEAEVGIQARNLTDPATAPAPAQVQTDSPVLGANFVPSPAPALLVATSSAPTSVINSDSDAMRVNAGSAPRERLDVNLLLVAIACGVMVISVVGFLAFYIDQKRHRDHDDHGGVEAIPSPPRSRPPGKAERDGYFHTGDSYDHFSPIPVWGAGKQTHVRL